MDRMNQGVLRRPHFGNDMVSTGVNETEECRPGTVAASLKSDHFSNANDNAGKVLAFVAPPKVAPQAMAMAA